MPIEEITLLFSYYSAVSVIKTETLEQKNVSNIFFFSESILFNTIDYI